VQHISQTKIEVAAKVKPTNEQKDLEAKLSSDPSVAAGGAGVLVSITMSICVGAEAPVIVGGTRVESAAAATVIAAWTAAKTSSGDDAPMLVSMAAIIA